MAGLGEDLDWLWTPTLFDTWTAGQAVGAVTEGTDAVRVVVKDRGLAPFPAPVAVTYADGRTERVELDPEGLVLDADLSNNVYTAK